MAPHSPPPIAAMNRRDFLKLSGIGTLMAGFGATLYRVKDWIGQRAADGYAVLSREEAAIAQSIADAMFPGEPYLDQGLPNGNDVGVVEHLDQYLASIDDRSSQLLRMLLHLVDDVSFLVGLGMAPFHERSRSERIEILRAWDNSSIAIRRKGFRGLKLVLAAGYCTNARVLEAADVDFQCETSA